MEGPIKAAVAKRFDIELRGRAQGSSALARLIEGGNIRPDIFISVTPGPMQIVLKAGKAQTAAPIARTEMVIAYSPISQFAPRFAEAEKRGSMRWWQILEQPELRFGRTDPITDPQGRNIIFTLELAARYYRQPDLVARILGAVINPRQIFPEPTVLARLQAGELDASSAYKIQPASLKLPYLRLPDAINLGSNRLKGQYSKVNVTLDGKVYHPEPLVYYAAVLKDARNLDAAQKLVNWLGGDEAQAIFRQHSYDPPGDAEPLRA
jgi:molybdate/tungstate transport system substrate-binding protein